METMQGRRASSSLPRAPAPPERMPSSSTPPCPHSPPQALTFAFPLALVRPWPRSPLSAELSTAAVTLTRPLDLLRPKCHHQKLVHPLMSLMHHFPASLVAGAPLQLAMADRPRTAVVVAPPRAASGRAELSPGCTRLPWCFTATPRPPAWPPSPEQQAPGGTPL
jgi:hypothetical protein